jgi:general secretion pathway protein A
MYTRFYNLTANPFRLNPDPRLLYCSQTHGKALAYLKYGLQTGEGFVAVTGNAVTGKTTLVRYILAGVDRSTIAAVELAAPRLESGGILRLLSAALGLAYQQLPESSLLKNIENFLMARARERKRVLLVVDEAQNLGADALEELRMLCNLQAGERTLLQTFLVGQQEFRDQLQSPGLEQLRQRIIASCHLEALNAEETQAYVYHRLQRCGWQDDPQFMDEVFARIHEHTLGIPRRINRFCNRLFLHGCAEQLHAFDDEAAITVMEEETQELHMTEGSAWDNSFQNQQYPVKSDDEGDDSRPLRPENTTISNEERRLLSLERRVVMLEKTVHEERLRFQRLLRLLAPDDERHAEPAQSSIQSTPAARGN